MREITKNWYSSWQIFQCKIYGSERHGSLYRISKGVIS